MPLFSRSCCSAALARAADVDVEMLTTLGMSEALVGLVGAWISLYGAEKEYTCVSLPAVATVHLRRRRGDGVLVGGRERA